MNVDDERIRRLESVKSQRSKSSLGELSRGLSLVSSNGGPRLSIRGGEERSRSQFPSSAEFEGLNDDGSFFEDETDSISRSSRRETDAKPELIASEQTKQIWALQVFVKIVLVVATCLTAAAIFYNLRAEEVEQFEGLFQDHATKVVDGFQAQLQQTVKILDNFGVSYTSEVRLSSMEWPFVSLPDFQFRGPSTRSTSAVRILSFLPVVSKAERIVWERYALGSASWVSNETNPELANNVFAVARTAGIGGPRDRRALQSQKEEFQVDKQAASENGPRPGTAPVSLQSSIPMDAPTMTIPPTLDASEPTAAPGREPPPVNQQNESESIQKPQLPSDGGKPLFPPPFQDSLSLRAGEPIEFLDEIPTTVYRQDAEERPVVEDYNMDYFLPIWQSTPTVPQLMKLNMLSHETFGAEVLETLDSREVTVGKMIHAPDDVQSFVSVASDDTEPVSQIYVPVFDDFTQQREIVGLITGILRWNDYFANNLPTSSKEPLICVLKSGCGQSREMSYRIEGKSAVFLGEGDRHDVKYSGMVKVFDFDTMVEQTPLASVPFSRVALNRDYCAYSVRVYPTAQMEDQFITEKPLYYTVAVVLTFLVTVLMLALLSYLQERRHKLVLETAAQTNAVVSSLFPAVVRDRLLGGKSGRIEASSAKHQLKSYLDQGKKKDKFGSKPIADLFPCTTVMFADISGFTAWSSVREPHQVFTLLETLYQAFDYIAKKRRVFKVETIGDCYVAVTGLPDPQEEHAIIMAKFAMECMHRMNDLAKKLERQLGPDTGDLMMRFGLHSGPTIAGVLRGEKSRFQLFGDTVNTASRMESTGKPDRIQCSQATADLIIAGGKSHWICPRDEIVRAKGKGEVQTFWIDPRGRNAEYMDESCEFNFNKRSLMSSAVHSAKDLLSRDIALSGKSLVWGDSKNFDQLHSTLEEHKHQRLIDWNVNIFKVLLKQIVVNRARRDHSKFDTAQTQRNMGTGPNPRNQVTEAIIMPQFDAKTAKAQVLPDSIGFELSSTVVAQLKSYLTAICMLYHDDNPFHNYEHASHVTMSANKLLKRVVAPDDVYDRKASVRKLASNLHEYTYGITSDPLTQFAIIFSALIHDVDHGGVSNGQLVKEQTHTALKYEGESVAEQNSIHLAWDLLMDSNYKDLRTTIYANEIEFRRFRQLVVNSVIATDIFDKDLKASRNRRWEIAFHQNVDDKNLKATIVIEHIIQAADVSHTMQHWHIYQKWNERLFREMYSAYRSGRGGDTDPSEGWYKGELWFYDNYVIPLAQKLKECGVFGVASAECLTYALDNRREWEAKGEEIVSRMKVNYSAPKWAQSSSTSIASTDDSFSHR